MEGGVRPEHPADEVTDAEAPAATAPEGVPPVFGHRPPMWADTTRDWRPTGLPLEHEGFTRTIETGVLGTARWFDRLQARVSLLGFAYGVFKKYADDEGSKLAALMAYYTFLSLFPLAIGGVAILNEVLRNYPETVQQIIDQVVPPQYEEQILNAYNSLPSGGTAAWIAIIGLLWAGTSGVFALYSTINQVYAVPYRYRYGYGPRYARIFVVIFIMAIAVIVVAVGGGVVASLFDLPALGQGGVLGLTAACFSGALYLSTKILSRRVLAFNEVALGAILGGIIVTSVVTIGSRLVSIFVTGSTPVYGAFATVVGIISVLLLGTNGVVISLEISVVLAWQLWPRGIDIHLLFPADERAYALLSLMDERMPSQRNDVRFDAEGHFDPRRYGMELLDHRLEGLPRSPYHDPEAADPDQDSSNSATS